MNRVHTPLMLTFEGQLLLMIEHELPKIPEAYIYQILRFVPYQKSYMVVSDKNIRDTILKEQADFIVRTLRDRILLKLHIYPKVIIDAYENRYIAKYNFLLVVGGSTILRYST